MPGKIPMLAALSLVAALAALGPDAQAQDRARARIVAHGPNGGHATALRGAGHGPNLAGARGRNLRGDGQGNVHGRSGGYVRGPHGGIGYRQDDFYRHADGSAGRSRDVYVQGGHGGSAQRQADAYRNSDGSAGRSRSTSASGRYGGSLDASGSFARDADGTLSGSRSTSAGGRNGGHYTGSTTVQDGVLTHTRSCTDAAGQAVACRRD